jgi:hypothetical protein
MELVGEYVYKLYYILPDVSKIEIDRLINFCLNDNYEAIERIKNSSSSSYYFDSTDYGCLEVEYYEIEKCFKKIGLIDDWCKILDKEKVLKHLQEFEKDSTELCNNKELYIRDSKIEKILK